MTPDPLQFDCPHIATEAEQRRDPAYLWCRALAGMPCVWARRWDGEDGALFHAERYIAAAESQSGKVDAAAIALRDGDV